MNGSIDDFKKELKALLIKYGIMLYAGNHLETKFIAVEIDSDLEHTLNKYNPTCDAEDL